MNSKRKFIKLLIAGVAGFPLLRGVRASYKPKVVVIGGGFGGGTVLRYLENLTQNLDITLIEKNKHYYTCPFSNYVIGGFREIKKNKFSYNNIQNRGMNVIIDKVKFIDSAKKKIYLTGQNINYDWLVLSPGIDFKWNSIKGFTKKEALNFPIAWSGGKESDLLHKKINSLEDNSKLIIIPPDYPYRCPPAPYERASLIANLLVKKKKKFKILILDKKDSFTKQDLFFSAWNKLYPGLIEWVSRSKGGEVSEFIGREKCVVMKSGEKIYGDFFNIIPDQKASNLVLDSELSLQDWCKVNPITFELAGHKNIHAVGDTINAWSMPKSAFSANSQAKVCAENLKNIIFEKKLKTPVFLNACYSLASENYGFAISSWYKVNSEETQIVSLGSKSSPISGSSQLRKSEVKQSYDWYSSITDEVFS